MALPAVLFVLFIAAFPSSASAAAADPPKPTAPYLVVPKTARWKVDFAAPAKSGETAETPDPNRPLRAEYWVRGSDYKSVLTYASGRTVTSLVSGDYAIWFDSAAGRGAFSYLSAVSAEAGEEQRFAKGYANPFAMLNWVDAATYARADKHKGKPVFVYQKPSSNWTAFIDPETRLPVACAFGDRVYEFTGLQVGMPLPDAVFALPKELASRWQKHEKELAHQQKLWEINNRKR